MVLDCVLAVAWDVLKMAYDPIKRRLGYVTSSKRYAQDLETEIGKLEYQAERIHDTSEVARNNLRNVYSQVVEWQKNAELALEKERDLLSRFNEADKTCCYGTVRDPICRYQFSRKAKHMIEDIQRLAREGGELKEIFSIAPPPGNVAASTPDYSIFESRALIIQDIMDALADNSNSVVGVHGMGGVGKSTLLVDVQRRIGKEKQFDLVAKTDVSANPDIKRIQEDIAYALGLDIKDYQHETARAAHLRSRLEAEEKKVLIILDNLWEKLNLESVGIPCGHNNQVIKCKLLLTSRDRNILQREMGCDKEFLLHGLDEKEAKILFEGMVGDKVHRDEFRILVDKALRKCAGLPLLIATMAKNFKHADLPEWTDALTQIERCTNEGTTSAVLNMTLQLSYDHLKSEQAKSLLRLCVSYGVSEPSVENLVRDGYGWGMFGTDCTMKEARERLSTLISTLQASHLLLGNGGSDGFKVHDLVHEFVAKVILRNQPPLVLKDIGMLTTRLWKERLKICSAVCFPHMDMKELPEELDCPEMRIFLLSSKNESFEVPDSYFNSMRKLEVLNLTNICLSRSPMPFQSIENLRTLSLRSCSLEAVAILGKLKGLQVLSLARSEILQLPKEIGQLVELRLLDLSYCSRLQIIEKGVLGSLINLEELYMEDSFDQWSAVDQASASNASLNELNHMKNLCTLHVCIRDLSVIPRDLNIEKLTKYRIRIGQFIMCNFWRLYVPYKGSRTLELKLNPESNVLQRGCIRTTLDVVDDLWMDGLNGVEQSICQLSLEGFPQLKFLHVQNSPSVRFILKGSSLPAFKSLELLYLESLINLEKLCHNSISSQSFSALKVVRVRCCHKLEVLFPLSLLRQLPQVEELKVVDCKLMRGIVESDDCGQVELHNLHVLELRDLPNIKSFITMGTAPSSSSASSDQVDSQAFFNGQQVAFPKLERLDIHGIDDLEFIFSPSMVKSLTQLKKLNISSCKKIEAIVMEEEGLGTTTSETLAFLILTDLTLCNLGSLTCFSRGKCSQEAQIEDHVKSRSSALFHGQRLGDLPGQLGGCRQGFNTNELRRGWPKAVLAGFCALQAFTTEEKHS